jgi:hypothetical protein
VGQKILADLTDADPNALLLIMKESQDDERIRNAALARNVATDGGDPADYD